MKRRKKPATWQLDVFVVVMTVSLLFLMWAQLPPSWYTVVEWLWGGLMLVGMGMWIWANWEALQKDDRHRNNKRTRQQQSHAVPQPVRSIPITPVQKHFLEVMDQ